MVRSSALVAVALCVNLAACNNSGFSGAGGKKVGAKPPAPASPPADEPEPQQQKPQPEPVVTPTPTGATETFAVTESEGLLDLVWVIDNSGSMNEEAAQVRDNFSKFLTTVEARADVHVALVSAKAEGSRSTGVTLPDAFVQKGGVQLEHSVQSNDPLMVAALATCAAAQSSFPPFDENSTSEFMDAKVCGKSLQVDTFLGGDTYADVIGKLSSFFRPQAKPIYVFVTDDEALEVTDQNFVSLVQPALGAQAPAVFAFSGRDNRSGCRISRRGLAYEALAKATGGATYDMCEPDWSANFTELSKSVGAIASLTFTLKGPNVGKIKSVAVDGQQLSVYDYDVNGNVVTLKQASVPKGSKEVVITYDSK